MYISSQINRGNLRCIFLSLKSQFANFNYYKKEFAFVRTEHQIDKIIKECKNLQSIILYTIVKISWLNIYS